MNREVEINNFLRHLAKIYAQNPRLPIESDTIYYYLMTYDISNNEVENSDIKDHFDKWIQHFKNNPNINVFYTEYQNRFLQFSSNNHTSYRCIKLYLSFPKDKIYECVNKVFEYVALNNMPNGSKVADMIRSDSVVIRLNNIEDARKVINFVNNDLELSNSCKKSNPFLLKEGNVGIAYDYMLSYNTVLSFLLELYFKYCRMHNRLNEVSLSTLREYIGNFYNNVFSNKNNLEVFLNNPKISSKLHRFHGDEVALTSNFEEIIRLIYQSLNPNMDLEQYFNFYNKCLIEDKTHQNYNRHAQILGKQKDNSYEKAVELLNEYIKHAELKYGGCNVAAYLEKYIEGNISTITRDNDYRNRFRMYLSPEMIKHITNNNIFGYVEKCLKKEFKKNTSAQNYTLFLNACIATYKKYGANHLYTAIICSINGDYKHFTNDDVGYRNIMVRNDFKAEIDNYCKLIVQNYGNGIYLSNNLYENCTNAIINFVRQQNNEFQSKIM